MKAKDYFDNRMKDPEFREAVERLERHIKYWGWAYDLEAWVDYFIERFWEYVSRQLSRQ